MKCSFCSVKYSPKRKSRWDKHNRRFCSKMCMQRAWCIRRKTAQISSIKSGPNLITATGKGLHWEIHAGKLLNGDVLALSVMNRAYDILTKDGKRVDVKSSNVHINTRNITSGKKSYTYKTSWWSFHSAHPDSYKEIDYFFCIGLENDVPRRYFMIPAAVMPKTGISVPIKEGKRLSKWYKYQYFPTS